MSNLIDILGWSEEKCREYLASQRWPGGVICPKCGEGEAYTIQRKSD